MNAIVHRIGKSESVSTSRFTRVLLHSPIFDLTIGPLMLHQCLQTKKYINHFQVNSRSCCMEE